MTSITAASPKTTSQNRKRPFFAVYNAESQNPPLLSIRDIATYEWTNHTIKLTPIAALRLSKKFPSQSSSISCIIKIDGPKSFLANLKWIDDTTLQLSPRSKKTISFENNTVKNKLIRFRRLTIDGLKIDSGSPGKYQTCMTEADRKKSNTAYKKIYHRYGRDYYKSLREDLLKNEKDFTQPGEFIATLTIFCQAKDYKSLEKAIQGLNPQIIRDSYSWSRIEWISHTGGIKVYQAFIMAYPDNVYYPGKISSYHNKYLELLNSGKADKEEISAAIKMVDMRPDLYARFCKPLKRNEKACMNTINRQLAAHPQNATIRIKNIERMMSFITIYSSAYGFKLSNYPEIKQFLSLINLNNAQEVFYYINAANMLKMYDKAADLLVSRLELPVTDYEVSTLTCSQAMIPDKNDQEMVLEKRQAQLIDFLLKASRIDEAQKWTEKFYGNNTDPSKYRTASWVRFSMTQQPVELEKILDKTKPEDRTWNYYSIRYRYHQSKNDDKAALNTLAEAIKQGKAQNTPELVIYANRALIYYYSRKNQKDKALEIARKNNAYAVKNANHGPGVMRKAGEIHGTEARRAAATQLMRLLKEMKPYGWESEWEKVARREFLDGQTALLRNFLSGKRDIDKNYTIAPDDEIFTTLCGETFQKKNGFYPEAHTFRLEAVPFKDFENCLEQAMEDFLKYKKSENARPRLCTCFYGSSHRIEREALLAKYLFDTYPYTYHYLMIKSIPARNYKEGKKLLEKFWASNKIRPEERRKALLVLLKKAPDQTEKQWCKTELAKFGNASKK